MHRPTSSSLFTRIAAYCAIPLIAVSVLVVLIATLYPFSIQPLQINGRAALLDLVKNFLLRRSGAEDWQDNILLFMPLGFGLASLWSIRRFCLWWLFAILLCTGLSFTVECLQEFLPSRAPTAIDVITNTIGGGLGIAAFILLQGLCTTRRRFALITTVIAGCLFLLNIPLQRAARFSNWEYSYSLSVGNNPNGRRPWSGTIQTLGLSATGASPEQLISLTSAPRVDELLPWLVRYDFTAPDPLVDQTGQRRALTPVQSTQLPHGSAGVTLSNRQALLLPPDEVTPITAAIQRAVQMTTLFVATPQSQTQRGQIVTIAGDDGHLNLVIAQDGQDLAIQIRTPVTGEYVSNMMDMVVYSVFTGDQPHAIAISYAHGRLSIAVDGQLRPESLHITPPFAFFSLMLPFKANNVLARYDWTLSAYTILYTLFVFVPVGLALALWTRPRSMIVSRSLLVLGGAILATIIYAGLDVFAGGLWSSLRLMLFQVVVVLVAWAVFWRVISVLTTTGSTPSE
jgi:VanZ family protein